MDASLPAGAASAARLLHVCNAMNTLLMDMHRMASGQDGAAMTTEAMDENVAQYRSLIHQSISHCVFLPETEDAAKLRGVALLLQEAGTAFCDKWTSGAMTLLD
jgi:hypothetical protein